MSELANAMAVAAVEPPDPAPVPCPEHGTALVGVTSGLCQAATCATARARAGGQASAVAEAEPAERKDRRLRKTINMDTWLACRRVTRVKADLSIMAARLRERGHRARGHRS